MSENQDIVHVAEYDREGTTLTTIPRVEPFSIDLYERMRPIAKELATSSLIPAAYKGKEADIMLAMEKLRTLGLNPVTALSGTFVLNGRVSIFGQTWLGVVQAAPGYGGMTETWDEATKTATTTFKRLILGQLQSHTGVFSETLAKTAKIHGQNVHATYPKDMLQWRARTRAGDLFSDVLQGMVPAEVAEDYTVELDAQPPALPAIPIDTQ